MELPAADGSSETGAGHCRRRYRGDKPASLTPLTLLELGRILNDVLPAGVINIVTGRGSVVGRAILDHPDVDKVAFTGSTSVGYTVAAAAAKN